MRQFVSIIFILCHCLLANAQDSTLTYHFSSSFSGSSGPTPFWVHANNNGSVLIENYFASGWGGINKIYNPNNPRLLQFSGGFELITNYGKGGDLFFTDLYIASKVGSVEFLVGQKKFITGIVDTTLTTGSLAISGNARPIPKIQIAIPNFLPLAFTNHFLSVKATYSDGKLGASKILYGSAPQVPQTYFHHKEVYFRFGKQSSRLKIFAGMNHQVIWGSENKIIPVENLSKTNEYWHVISGKSLKYKKIGSHFGTYDVAVELLGKKWSYFLYRQNIFETGSLFKIINLADAMSGLKIKRNKAKYSRSTRPYIHTVLLEVIGTANQINRYTQSEFTIYKTANYFNDYVYGRGWSYYSRAIGTPLISEKNITTIDNRQNKHQFSNNNRLWAFHGGLHATWLKINFTFKGTYSRNFGTLFDSFESPRYQISTLLIAERTIPFLSGTTLTAGVSSDLGQLYPNSTGLIVGIKKFGFLN